MSDIEFFRDTPQPIYVKELVLGYKEQGYDAEVAEDEPGKRYEPHSHHEVRLFGLEGSAYVKIGGAEWLTVQPGEEVAIAEGEVHEAVIGPEGWRYIFAFPQGIEPYSHDTPNP